MANKICKAPGRGRVWITRFRYPYREFWASIAPVIHMFC